jgi:hypothetical protein
MALQDAGFEVIRLRTFSEALNFILNSRRHPDFWIVDVMMSIEDAELLVDGKRAIETTNMGLAAGLLLYRKIKEIYPKALTIILTSIPTPSILDGIERSLDGNDTCEAKLEMLPYDLAHKIQERLTNE